METPGSWWPHWHAWIEKQDSGGCRHADTGGPLNSIEAAPGSYVRIRS